jgi:hypothetical protein
MTIGNEPTTIRIEIIDHNQHRYPTVGDWFFEGDTLVIRASRMKDLRYSYLIALHEIIEALQCVENGVSEESVTEFDELFEQQRADGEIPGDAEPGDDSRAPYHVEHLNATAIESVIAVVLNVDWTHYEKALEDLDK